MTEQKLSPIALFSYKRLDTLQKTVEALKENYLASKSELHIFSDAARNSEDEIIVQKVRDYLKTITGFKNIYLNFATENKGLANSIISGTTMVLNKNESIIVLEDDLLTTPNFLTYMNKSLNHFKNEKRVYSVTGYSFNLLKEADIKAYRYDGYFINRGWPWGWGTWKDRWENIDWDVSDYKNFIKDKKARRQFSQGGSDLVSMLRKQMNGKLDSWAIRWLYHQYKVNGLSFYSVYSKTSNIGFDDFATHTKGSTARYIPVILETSKTEFTYPPSIEIEKAFQKAFQKKLGIMQRIVSRTSTEFILLWKKIKKLSQ
jgi:hypothetical protein